MSFPRYPKYKDSGVEWLGEVPGHWGVGQSRRLFALRNERALGSDKQLTASQEHGVIYQEDFIRIEGRRVVEVIKGVDILKHVEPNDFVISMRSFQGGIEWCKLRGCISSAYVMLVPCDRIHGPFFAYVLKSRSYIQALQTTSNLVRDGQALRYDNFTKVDLPLVPMAEQTLIAAFLDRETAKIDDLVAEQRRLMELLKEKRQAVISHAVTQGLNPHAPMKPSGIEWLGDVPAHWGIGLLGYLSSIQTGSTPDRAKPEYWEGDIPWLKTGEINYERILDSEERITEAGLANSAARIAEVGTLMMAMYGQGVTRGRVAILGIRAAYNQACAAIALGPRLCNEYAKYFFMMAYRFIRDTGNETSQMNLGSGTIAKIKILIPPMEEQKQIVSFFQDELSVFDTLTTEAQRAIDLLQERRTALISAAVTGKIDVRHHASEVFRGQGKGGTSARLLLTERAADAVREV